MNRFLGKIFHTYITNSELNATVRYDDTQYDAFHRLRISSPYSILDFNFIVDENDVQVSTKVTGTGTISRVQTHMELSVGAGDTAILQSRARGIYQSGKSLLVLMTAVLDADTNDTDIVSRCGYYDDNDGYYFEYTNNTLKIVERTSSSGVLTESSVVITGVDVSKFNIFWFDFEWLGVGKVRIGYIIDGSFITLHEFLHAGLLEVPYMNKASLFVRSEIESTTGTGKALFNCGSVSSEGGFNTVGRLFSADNHFTTKTVSNGVLTPMLSLRIASGSDINAVIQSIYVTATTNNAVLHYELFIVRDGDGSELNNPIWTSVSPYSKMEYDTSATGFNGGDYIITSGYLGRGSGDLTFETSNFNNLILTKNIDGVSDVLILTVGSLSGNENCVCNILWKEIL